ncbi:neutral/alkaline ceramidase-like enzyme [Prosthecobacter fusiformis]|uniref:Neutral ceramidase n=2 Tax=Prosthecobacter fusiformis TaxID=48464 RepID=A0A4R7SQW1_9BACT|nr:neutral/alkaline ceramidase-like enzyme [Prosthecobacter fusiformis]
MLFGWAAVALTAAEKAGWKVGAASVDITPEYPVRLSGYGSRTGPHEGIQMRLHAKALALTWDASPAAIMLTVDNCGVPATMRAEVLRRLKEAGQAIEDARFSLHSSHTHCAPALPGLLPFLFGEELPEDEQAAINRYGEELTGKLVNVVKEALHKQEPARVEWSTGKVLFAMNRRFKTETGYSNSPNPYGPVDHALPVLKVTDASGKLRALFTSYACHCTTLSINKTHPDWAGCAQKELELRFPGVVAMTAIGCGADQNPYPRRDLAHVERHGVDLAKEVVRLINEPMKAVHGPLSCANQEVMLPFDTPHDRATWEQSSLDKNKATARHARHFLDCLDRGEAIPAALAYTVQVWSFSDDLLTINLPGEVVVDYGLRFKKEYDRARTWVNSYTNDVPCYIPSQRVWEEGGYEAAGAMVYYGRPNRFASGVEEIIAQAVKELVPAGFVHTAGEKIPDTPAPVPASK